MKLPNEKLYRVGIAFLGAIFTVSGVLKCVNIYSFAHEAREYLDVYFQGFLNDYSLICATILCSIEITIGLWSFRCLYRSLFCIIAFVLLAFFTFITGVNLMFPSIFGSIESCGCFGEIIHFTPLTSFVKSTVLFCIAVILLTTNYKKITLESIMDILREKYTYISLALGTILPIYSLLAFNNLDHVTYILTGASILVIIFFYIYINYIKKKNSHND